MRTMTQNKKRILKGFLFIVILLALNTMFTYLFDKHVIAMHRITKKTFQAFRDLKENNGKIDVLVLGDSHPDVGINPTYFNCNVVKWCFSSEKYPYNYFKLKYYLSTYPPPQFLVLPLALHSFNSIPVTKFDSTDDFFWVEYMDYFAFGKDASFPFHYLIKYLKERYAPYIIEHILLYHWLARGYPRKMSLFGREALASASSKKSSPQKTAPPKKSAKKPILKKQIPEKPAVKAMKRPRPPYNPPNLSPAEKKEIEAILASESQTYTKLQYGHGRNHFAPLAVKYFKKILQLCREHHIKVILVKFPVAHSYRNDAGKYFKIRHFFKRIEAIIKPFNQKMPGSVYILDYLSLFFAHPEFLANAFHVNHNGAIIVSIKLNNFISTLFPSCAPRPVPPPFNTQ